MELTREKIIERKKEILIAAAAIALARSARKSIKYEGKNPSFNISVIGENTMSIIADRFDRSMKIISRLAGNLVTDQHNRVTDVVIDESSFLDTSEELEVWEQATDDKSGWTGHLE